jgi:hypothetical protein
MSADLIEHATEYCKKHNPSLMILTPCYGGQCFVNYVTCLMNTFTLFNQLNIPIKVEFCKNDSLVSRARNNLIAKAMSNETITHFLFIDSDITWTPFEVLKLIIADKDLVGGVYPIKHYDWNKLIHEEKNIVKDWLSHKRETVLNQVMSDQEYVQSRLLRYNINYVSSTITVKQNLTQVKHLATGFMMIKRQTIEKMSAAFPSTKYTDDIGFLKENEQKYAFALFDCGVENNHYLSEDWMFCTRWEKMGGEIYIDITIRLTHSGMEDYKGSYISSIV